MKAVCRAILLRAQSWKCKKVAESLEIWPTTCIRNVFVWVFFPFFPWRCKRLCGKPPLTPCILFLSVTERNPSSHSSHKMDSVQGDHCPVLIMNLEGFILAACRCAVKNIERAEASAWGMGKRRCASHPCIERPFQR